MLQKATCLCICTIRQHNYNCNAMQTCDVTATLFTWQIGQLQFLPQLPTKVMSNHLVGAQCFATPSVTATCPQVHVRYSVHFMACTCELFARELRVEVAHRCMISGCQVAVSESLSVCLSVCHSSPNCKSSTLQRTKTTHLSAIIPTYTIGKMDSRWLRHG